MADSIQLRLFNPDLEHLLANWKELDISEVAEVAEVVGHNFWHKVSTSPNLSEEFIEKFGDFVHWIKISKYQKLSEEFIWRHRKSLLGIFIFNYQVLSEDFIERWLVDMGSSGLWMLICECQVLSEDFIERHKDEVYWSYIWKYQVLSEEFILRNLKSAYWEDIIQHQKISLQFIYANREILPVRRIMAKIGNKHYIKVHYPYKLTTINVTDNYTLMLHAVMKGLNSDNSILFIINSTFVMLFSKIL